MVKSLFSGVTGLKTHQTKMDVIGNNISNVNTTGFKASVVTFSDIYYQTKQAPSGVTDTLGATNPRQVGYGVQLNTISPNMSQSGFTFSDHIYDMAIDGEGFFQVMDGSGNIRYTRAGVFEVDDYGNLVDANGYKVLGYSGDSSNQPPSSEPIQIIIPETQAKCSSATKLVNGIEVTISVSAPSDNTDMSVTFTDSDYPFATYSGGVLNIYFDKDKQYASNDEFEAEISKAIAAGGITLPDDVELKFEFGSTPGDTDPKIANNTIEGWPFETTTASGEGRGKYTVTQVVGGETITTDKYATVAFDTTDTLQNDITVALTYTAGSEVTITGAPTETNGTVTGAWAITIGDDATASKINDAIKEYIKANSNETTKIPSLTCTKFNLPMDSQLRSDAIADLTANDPITLEGGEGTFGFDVEALEAGAFGNNYKVTFAYSSSYGGTKAVWDENNLTVTICNDTTVDQINEAIKLAANGDTKRQVRFTTMTGLDEMNPAMREKLFSANPSVSLGNGDDSFYTKVAKSLGTFVLTDGRTGSPQSYSSLSNITVQSDGTIVAEHSVHGRMILGRVDIAVFDNPNGLTQVGGTMFMETVASGPAKVCIAGQDGAGEIIPNALEMSNVDLAQEFTDMITTQRGYQANSRVITTSDTMLEELLSLKR